jgi:response regulator RpfG family c-di-GMP phosphodiesterase
MNFEPLKIEPDFNEKPLILYVDDEEHNLNAFKAAFRRTFEVHVALSAQEALNMIHERKDFPFEVVISDQRMPDITGVEFLETIKVKTPVSVRMLLTGFADINAVKDAINKGEVYRYLTKPWDELALKRTILDGIEVHRLRVRNDHKTKTMQRANKQLEFLARQNLIS